MAGMVLEETFMIADLATEHDRLKPLPESGGVPATRLSSPESARGILYKRIEGDKQRSKARQLVKGSVDGNPPFRQIDLVKHGRADQCNVNWRIAEALLDQAKGAFYDVFSEVSTKAEVRVYYEGEYGKGEEHSSILTEEFDRFQCKDREFDYNIQRSQHDMCLYGVGPISWEDKFSPAIRAIPTGNLLVADNVSSLHHDWEDVVIRIDYTASELYQFIQNGEAARAVGWDVGATRRAIMHAHPLARAGNSDARSWEWHQQQLRNNNLGYSYEADVIPVAMLVFREFPRSKSGRGKLSKVIVHVDNMDGGNQKPKFLFQDVDTCDGWNQVLVPMHYDIGDGTYHSVKGMGVKFYSALEYQNRLLCSIADKAMQPKIMLRPLNAEAMSKVSMMQMGDYLIAPPGYEASQVGFSGMLEDALIVKRDFEAQLMSNLSQFRQGISKQDGNPITAAEVKHRASEQAQLGKTQLARYYEQLDQVYDERFRRAIAANIPEGCKLHTEVKEFQKCCKNKGIDLGEVRKNIESVKAMRVIGQGSSMLRGQTLEQFLGALALFPEEGRVNVIGDWVAAKAGQTLKKRYFPMEEAYNKLPDDHEAFAMTQVASMKVGVPPKVTDTQNHVTFARVFLQAAQQSIKSLEMGAQPEDVVAFLEVVGPAIQSHLSLIENDATRKPVVEGFREGLKQISQVHDKLIAQIQKQRQQQQEQAQQQDRVMTDEEIAQFKAVNDERRRMAKLQSDDARKNFKVQSDNTRKSVTTIQQMKLNDAKTASEIANKRRLTEAKATERNGESD